MSLFNKLSDRLTKSIDRLRGIKHITEDNIQDALGEIRRALIEADVALPVVKEIIDHIQTKAVGQKIHRSIRPGDQLIKLVQDELTHILGDEAAEINLKAQAPIVYVMAGLQGSGKTTTSAKLAYFLQQKHQKKVMLTSADVYRPAAIEQLKTLSSQIEAGYHPSSPDQAPVDIAKSALKQAKQQFYDILIIDTAGRLHIDDALMTEMQQICQATGPTEVLLVVDSMTGQDAANVAKAFNNKLELTGIILTKVDGDARGGAALSMKKITGKPIKFAGMGEKIDKLEIFHPDRIASRILGMGDIVSLVEEAQQKVDKKQADKMAKKLKKGKRFDFNDFLTQLKQLKKMGGMRSLMSKLPGMGKMPKAAQEMMDEKLFIKMEAIIQSMTLKERRFPALLNGSRKKRIAAGSGTNIADVNKLLKQFTQMQKMLKRFKGDKMKKRLKAMQGQLPPELLGEMEDQ